MSDAIVNFAQIKIRMKDLNKVSAEKNLAPISGHSGAVQEFAKLIDDDEEIMFFSSGSRDGKNRNGMIFVTNKRFILCLKLVLPYVEQFNYDKITSIDYSKNFFGQGVIEINSYGDKVKFSYYETEKLIDVVKYIRKMMEEAKAPKVYYTTTNNEVNVIDQLERLAKLKESGILTQEEFEAQKAKILGK